MLRRSRRRTRSTRSPYCGAGPWLEAAPDLPQYDGERQRRVFETLAKVLPPGLPVRDRRARNRRLIYENATEVSSRTESG